MKSLLRLSFMLASLTLVGFLGLNGALDPANVARVQAHAITIEATSNGNPALTFGITAACNTSTTMAPGDQCVATVVVENTGEGDVDISDPDLEVSGALFTCDGGNKLTVALSDYTPNTNFLEVGDTVSFSVTVNLLSAAGNPCQGQSALIEITINADCDPDDIECGGVDFEEPDEPDEPERPTRVSGNPPSVSQIGAATSTPPAPSSFTAEVAPARFPTTGSGGLLDDDMRQLSQLLLIGTGSLAAALLIASFLVWKSKQEQD